jgi:hypothetical protein
MPTARPLKGRFAAASSLTELGLPGSSTSAASASAATSREAAAEAARARRGWGERGAETCCEVADPE